MPDEPTEYQLDPDDSILRNIRLISTPYNVFIFIGIPILLAFYVGFSIDALQSEKIHPKVSEWLFFIAIIILPCALVGIFMIRAETIQDQLKQQGYEQRPTRARRIDFGINWVVLAAFAYWTQHYKKREGESEFILKLHLWLTIVLGSFMLWLLFIMMSIGRMVWFTVKLREPEQR